MRLAAHQPNYLPWCGYFAKARACDVFVFLDDVEMPCGRSYVYRCMLRDAHGTKWLSVPTRHHLHDVIADVTFADQTWPRKHLDRLAASYGRSPHFSEVFSLLEPIYQEPGDKLYQFNIRLICAISDYLGLSCRFELSSLLGGEGRQDARHISLARIVGADTYVSGKGAVSYQNPAIFAAAGVRLEEHEYRPVPYDGIHGPFIPGLSILDALFNLGRKTVHLLDYPILAPRDPGQQAAPLHAALQG